MPQEQEETGRNEDGTFRDGVSGNPGGRPEGVSIVALLRRKLKEKPEDEDERTYLERAVDVILKKAITDEDEKMLRDMIDRIDGKPKQSIGLENPDGTSFDGFIIKFVTDAKDS